MADNYCRIPALKQLIGHTSVAVDENYRTLVDAVSRQVDIACQRHFYSQVATRYFSGRARRELMLFDGALFHDLLSVTSLVVDIDGDNTFETTLVADTDYWLEPMNVRPNEPYTSILLNPRSSLLTLWPSGRRNVKVTGTWGFSNETEATGLTVDTAAITDSATTLPVNKSGSPAPAADAIAVGDTLVIGSEQLYVSGVASGASWTVTRGVNGTTAAAHVSTTAIYRRRYDRQIEMAVLEQCSRLARELGTGFAGAVGSGEFGFAFSALYPDIAERLNSRRRGLGVA